MTIYFSLFRITSCAYSIINWYRSRYITSLLLVHRESKPPHWFGESRRVFIRNSSTVPVPTSFIVLILDYKLVRIYLHYPLVMLLLILTMSLVMIFSLLFARVNTHVHLTLFLALYLIHILLPLFMLLFVYGLISFLKSVSDALSS